MYLSNFELTNLGPIVEVDLPLDRYFNVVAGVNGAGKSTVLGALAIMLGRYSSAVRTGKAVGTFDRERIRKGARSTQAVVAAVAREGRREREFKWSAGMSRPGRKITGLTHSRPMLDFALDQAVRVEDDPDKGNLPIVVAYPVNRAVLDVPLRVRATSPYGQYSALEDALSFGGRSFRTFFAWFREREDVENETRAEGSSKRDPQLTAVRRAVAGMMPGFENLRVRRQPVRMLITKQGHDLRVDELSDGEKCMLALVGDLARRLALANPGLKNALRGEAVVLIDELELHLHPAWQRDVVVRLRETFPNCQFIVSTHSAQVLSEVRPEATFLLRDGRVVRPVRSQGRTSNLILQELMGVPDRPVWAQEALDELYELIDDEELDEAANKLRELQEQLGEDPGLAAARSLLAPSRADR